MIWRWPAVTLTVEPDAVVSRFRDGKVNTLDLTRSNGPNYRKVVEWAGYDDTAQYAREHDITHHALAYHLGWSVSRALHDGDVNVPLEQADPVIQWEEWVVNRLQRYARCGAPDERGIIHRLFRNLDKSAAELRRVWETPSA